MKMSVCKSYGDLPLFLNAKLVAQVLGVSISTAYEVMHEPSFPTLRVGSRMVVPKEKFMRWVEEQSGGAKGESRAGPSGIPSKTISHCPTRSTIWGCPAARSRCTVSCSAGRTARPISACSATGRSARAWVCA